LDVTRDEVRDYLSEVKKSVNDGRYQISPRTKNQSLYIDYVFSEKRCKEILLDLARKYRYYQNTGVTKKQLHCISSLIS